jgi:Zn-dependent protease with chaperone function
MNAFFSDASSTYVYRRVGLFLLSACFITGCGTVPITGRSQISLVSDAQLISEANQNFSRLMADVTQKKLVVKESDSPEASEWLEVVHRVSDRIIDVSGLRDRYKWQTLVIKQKEPNAFVMPNGKMVVHTGIFSIAKNEAGLAAILGHEVAHVTARHSAERKSQELLTNVVLSTADAALSSGDPKQRGNIRDALGMGAQYGFLLPFSREHESEADRIGLIYMAKAGYDPAEAVGVWERMETAGGSGPLEFMSTHPNPGTRRTQLRDWLPEAYLYYADSSRPLPTKLADLRASRPEHTSKMAQAPIAAQPAIDPGFWYRVSANDSTGPTTYRFNRKAACPTGECMVLQGDKGRVFAYTADYALVEVRESGGSWTRFHPSLRLIRWPLRVGDTWTESVRREQSSGAKHEVVVKGNVVGYEFLTVPAGSFPAYKIILSMDGVRFWELWYAPETRTFLRAISYGSDGRQVVSELIDFQKSSGAAGPIKAE